MRLWTPVGCSVLALAVASTARANMLTNGSLESPLSPTMPENLIYASPTLNPNALPGWTITQGTIDVVPTAYWTASNGNFSVDLVGTPGLGGIKQSVTTVAATDYTLSFDLAANFQHPWLWDETNATKRMEVEAFDSLGNLIKSQTFDIAPGTRTKTAMQFVLSTFNFTAADTTTTIQFTALTPSIFPPGLTGAQLLTGAVIDNISLDPAGGNPPDGVPEPASLAVLGLGGTLLLRRRPRA